VLSVTSGVLVANRMRRGAPVSNENDVNLRADRLTVDEQGVARRVVAGNLKSPSPQFTDKPLLCRLRLFVDECAARK
jgi:hypothetical protein